MIDVTLNDKAAHINAILTAFPDKITEVYNKGIKAGLKAADKASMSEIPKTYAITRANLNDKNSTRKRLKAVSERAVISGEMNYSGYRLPLYRFSVAPRLPVNQSGTREVRAHQLVGGNNEPWKSGFIAQMKSGHIGVFTRDGRPRKPISEVMGASVAEMVGNTIVLEKTEMAAYEAVVNGAEKQIQRILAGG